MGINSKETSSIVNINLLSSSKSNLNLPNFGYKDTNYFEIITIFAAKINLKQSINLWKR